jgi:diguanylate cyclase (GGDEF)-like protein
MRRRYVPISISGRLIVVLAVVILVFCSTIGMIVFIMRDLDVNSTLINDVGKIRGGIQRIIKKEISGSRADNEINDVDILINEFSSRSRDRLVINPSSDEFSSAIQLVAHKWAQTKKIITEYHISPVTKRRELVDISEELWDIANNAVFIAEATSHRTVIYFYFLAAVSGCGIIVLLGILLVTKIYVRDRIEYLANHDHLTGVFNRSYFFKIMKRECSLSDRSGRTFFVIMCDLDFFKRVNDSCGHDGGDDVLKEVTAVMRDKSRESDLVARLGGEEFAIVIIEETIDKVRLYAEKLREAVENLHPKCGAHITLSIGIAMYESGDSPLTLLKKADRAMYRAKDKGRNRVVVY